MNKLVHVAYHINNGKDSGFGCADIILENGLTIYNEHVLNSIKNKLEEDIPDARIVILSWQRFEEAHDNGDNNNPQE